MTEAARAFDLPVRVVYAAVEEAKKSGLMTNIGSWAVGFSSCVLSEPSMSSTPIHVVVLAAGQGTRMKSSLPKVLHRVPGGAMLDCVIRTAESLSPETLTIVVGHGADAVRAHLGRHRRRPIRSPGAAARNRLTRFSRQHRCSPAGLGRSFCLSGDVPLLHGVDVQ